MYNGVDTIRQSKLDFTMFDYPHRPLSDTQSPRFRLRFGSARPVVIDLDGFGWVLVGRKTPQDEGAGLGVDLTPYGGAEHGVSRNHAALSYMEGQIYVEDLGSTSGTRLNGLALEPSRKYHLRHNDELEFGSVRATVLLR
jgi:hypothetical protein